MKIPKKLKIGGHVYDILWMPNNRKQCGETETADLKIRISPEFPQSQQEETIIHEILHAVRVQLSLNDSDTDKEERMVNALAGALYQVLNDNRMLK